MLCGIASISSIMQECTCHAFFVQGISKNLLDYGYPERWVDIQYGKWVHKTYKFKSWPIQVKDKLCPIDHNHFPVPVHNMNQHTHTHTYIHTQKHTHTSPLITGTSSQVQVFSTYAIAEPLCEPAFSLLENGFQRRQNWSPVNTKEDNLPAFNSKLFP